MNRQEYVFVVLLEPLIGSQKQVHLFQRKIFSLHLIFFLLVIVVLLVVVVQVRDQYIQAMRNSDS